MSPSESHHGVRPVDTKGCFGSTTSYEIHMGQFPQDGENGQNVAFFIFLERCCDQTVWFFQLFPTVLKRFCPLDFKNVFVLVLAHLEPELELFEVDDIGDDGDDDVNVPSKPPWTET